jgi:iron complex outermembrane receptor protein
MSMTRFRSTKASLGAKVLGVILPLAALPAAAQDAGAQAAPKTTVASADGDDALATVTVTALFRSTELQSTPLAISAVTGDQLAQRSVHDVADLNNLAPSVNISSTGAYGGHTIAAYIRGIGAGSYNYNVEPGVAFYLDDVYLGPSMGLALNLIDLDRVEILRGPQGTLSGKNAIGGAIKLVPTRPKGSDTGYAEVEGGSLGLVRVRAAYDLGIIDNTLAMRISGYSSHRDGYVDLVNFACAHPDEVGNSNAPLGLKWGNYQQSCITGSLGDEDIHAARVQFRYTPTEDLEFNLSADYVADDSNGAADVLIGINPSSFNAYNQSTAVPLYGVPYDNRFLPPNHYTSYSNFQDPQYGLQFPPVNTLLTKDVTLNGQWKINPNLALTNILGYRYYIGHWSYDSDSSPLATDGVYDTQWHEQYSEEMRLSGTNFNDRWNWTAGLFYYKDRDRDIATVEASLFTYFSEHNDIGTDEAKALYLHSEYKLTDQLTLITGVRESKEDKSFLFSNNDLPGTPGHSFPGGMYKWTYTQFSHFDWRAGLSQQFTPTFMVYANVMTGFRSGGFNPQPSNATQIIGYGPEILTEGELGFRNELFDRRVRFNNTIYLGHYEDVQLTARLPIGGGNFPANVVTNAGTAKIYGFESELQADVNKFWSVNGTGSYTHFRYTDLGLAAGLAGGPTLNTMQAHTPVWRMDAGTEFNLPLLQQYGKLQLHADYSYQSSQFDDTANTTLMRIPAYGVLNGKLTFTTNKSWQISLGGTNLTDRFYYSNKNYITGQVEWKGVPSLPRMWNVTVRKDF